MEGWPSAQSLGFPHPGTFPAAVAVSLSSLRSCIGTACPCSLTDGCIVRALGTPWVLFLNWGGCVGGVVGGGLCEAKRATRTAAKIVIFAIVETVGWNFGEAWWETESAVAVCDGDVRNSFLVCAISQVVSLEGNQYVIQMGSHHVIWQGDVGNVTSALASREGRRWVFK
ncbi:hypothetical protein F0562_010148 [Nyssa sinensis]|uniref:Uncharacterized protein n=1 Tax=Nyssa sinensis TaxID=561372 RepID=A0A5J4ZY19_9ASTE|nr:hypothetical protein F0562_010148 [Nyssa sinensis]